MGKILNLIWSSTISMIISPINALDDLIHTADATIISEEGYEILCDQDKRRQVVKQIEDYKKNAAVDRIVVDL